MSVIYCIYNMVTNKVYIGQTSQSAEKRWRQHIRDGRRKRYEHYPFYRAIAKYGVQSFELSELGVANSQDEADNLERLWILLLQAREDDYGYNIRAGGHRGANSPETRAKISAARTGQPSWNKGKKMRPETKLKLQSTFFQSGHIGCKGRVLSEETKAKIGAKSKGRRHSEEFKKWQSDRVKKLRSERFWSSRNGTEQI